MTEPHYAIQDFLPTSERLAERNRLLAATYFLVRQAGGPMGEILRCGRCNGKHRYLTLMCVEQPFSGLTGGLFAYYHTGVTKHATTAMSPAQRERFDWVRQVLDVNLGPDDFSKAHPLTARKLGASDRDLVLAGASLGILEPVDKRTATKLVAKIHERGWPLPLRLPGIEEACDVLHV